MSVVLLKAIRGDSHLIAPNRTRKIFGEAATNRGLVFELADLLDNKGRLGSVPHAD